MAVYHCHVETRSRVHGDSAEAIYKYIVAFQECQEACDRLVYQAHGNLPSWSLDDPGYFWRMVDLMERANGRLCKTIMLALPNELSIDDNIALCHEFVGQISTISNGGRLPFSFAIHQEPSGHNPHLHLMIHEHITDNIPRLVTEYFKQFDSRKPPEKCGAKKTDELKPREWIFALRKLWEEKVNRRLIPLGYAPIDCRSKAAKGDDSLVNIHLGPWGHKRYKRMAAELDTLITDEAEIRELIEAYEPKLKACDDEIAEAELIIEQLENMPSGPPPPHDVTEAWKYLDAYPKTADAIRLHLDRIIELADLTITNDFTHGLKSIELLTSSLAKGEPVTDDISIQRQRLHNAFNRHQILEDFCNRYGRPPTAEARKRWAMEPQVKALVKARPPEASEQPKPTPPKPSVPPPSPPSPWAMAYNKFMTSRNPADLNALEKARAELKTELERLLKGKREFQAMIDGRGVSVENLDGRLSMLNRDLQKALNKFDSLNAEALKLEAEVDELTELVPDNWPARTRYARSGDLYGQKPRKWLCGFSGSALDLAKAGAKAKPARAQADKAQADLIALGKDVKDMQKRIASFTRDIEKAEMGMQDNDRQMAIVERDLAEVLAMEEQATRLIRGQEPDQGQGPK